MRSVEHFMSFSSSSGGQRRRIAPRRRGVDAVGQTTEIRADDGSKRGKALPSRSCRLFQPNRSIWPSASCMPFLDPASRVIGDELRNHDEKSFPFSRSRRGRDSGPRLTKGVPPAKPPLVETDRTCDATRETHFGRSSATP